MLLTCPHCRSGLEVPDGTTALVRCPACKTVFSPADGAAPEPDEDDEDERKPKARRRDEDEEDQPRKRRNARADNKDDEDDDEDEEDDEDDSVEARRRSRKKRRREAEAELTLAEKVARRRAFDRAAWGCRLIAISFALFLISMVFITGYFFQGAFAPPMHALITIAGVLGLVNWVLAAIGIGLCLSGPPAPGHWGYGIAAAVAIAIHFIFLMALVSQGKEFAVGKTEGTTTNSRWGILPTRLNATMFYMTAVLYPDDQGVTPKGPMMLSMLTGVAEMVRTVLIMMFLSCLARSALDEDLAHKCTRAAGIASVGPGALAVLIFLFVAFVVETNAGLNMFTIILSSVVNMGVYSIINGVMFPAYMATRDVTDACEEPFQSLIPNL